MSTEPEKPIIAKMDLEEELDRLNNLYFEVKDLLDSWDAQAPKGNETSPVAVVALLELLRMIRLRRRWLLDQMVQLELPF